MLEQEFGAGEEEDRRVGCLEQEVGADEEGKLQHKHNKTS